MNDFVVRLRRAVHGIGAGDEMIHYAMLGSLRPAIGGDVLQQSVVDFETTLHAARIGEAMFSSDPIRNHLQERRVTLPPRSRPKSRNWLTV